MTIPTHRSDPVVALQQVLVENALLREKNITLELNNQMLAATLQKLGVAAVELELQINVLRTEKSASEPA